MACLCCSLVKSCLWLHAGVCPLLVSVEDNDRVGRLTGSALETSANLVMLLQDATRLIPILSS